MRRPDLLWEALAAELGDVSTTSERGVRNAALKQLREVDATPEDIRRRCHAYRVRWPCASLTAPALVKHWSSLAPPKAKPAPPVTEVLNLPELTPAEIAENLERARALSQSIGRQL